MNSQELIEQARRLAVSAISDLSESSVEYSIATRGTASGFEMIVLKRPESQVKERQERTK